jgi:hypothetical protein
VQGGLGPRAHVSVVSAPGKRATLSQSQLSRLERSANVEVSTLARYVHAAGGRLEMSAIVKGKRLTILSENEIR